MLGLCHFWLGIVSLNNIHIGTFAWKSWQLCTCNWVAVLLFHFSAATDGAHVPTHTEEVDDDDVPGETLLFFSFTLLQTNKLITRKKKVWTTWLRVRGVKTSLLLYSAIFTFGILEFLSGFCLFLFTLQNISGFSTILAFLTFRQP